MTASNQPKLAVFKFASCDGCQLSLLDLEDELLALSEAVEIAYFLEATRAQLQGPYDVTLVEGSVTTEADARRILEVRRLSRRLVTIGACATAGGIQALKNFAHKDEYVGAVYARPEYVQTLDTSTPIAAHVRVDYELRGCPVNKRQLLEVLLASLHGRAPNVPQHSVCLDCKRQGVTCVMVAGGVACLGPVTQSGCGALCPSFRRGCFGCYGPMESARPEALASALAAVGTPDVDVRRLYGTFNVAAEPFRTAHLGGAAGRAEPRGSGRPSAEPGAAKAPEPAPAGATPRARARKEAP